MVGFANAREHEEFWSFDRACRKYDVMAYIDGIVLSSVYKIDPGCFQTVFIDIYLYKKENILLKTCSKRLDIWKKKLVISIENNQPSPL